MKHLKKIVLFFIFLIGINIIIPTQSVFASDCNLTKDDISFDSINIPQGKTYPYIENDITLRINTSGKCDNKKIKVKLRESDTPNNTNNNNDDEDIDINADNDGYVDDDKDIVIIQTKSGEDTYIKYNGGGDDCEGNSGPDCSIYVIIYDEGNHPIVSTKSNLDTGNNFSSGVLKAECSTYCGSGDWDFISTNAKLPNGNSNSNNTNTNGNGNQNQTSSYVCNITKDDISFDDLNIPQNKTYPNIMGKNVKLHINTKGKCEKQKIGVLIREHDTSSGDDDIDIEGSDYFVDEDNDKVIFYTPENDNTTISYKADDDDCDSLGDPDCELYVEISREDDINTGNIIASTEANLSNGTNFSSGILLSNCGEEDNCTVAYNDWEVLETNGTSAARFEKTNPAMIVDAQRPNYDPNSPCIKDKNDPSKGYIEGCYEFLAPIQGIEKKDDGSADPQFKVSPDGRRIAIKDVRTYQLGDYINKIFQIAIGILGVLSVVMIIIAGVQYMTVESIVGKSDAKERIIGAVSGLLLSLGIFIILNTINPNLLEVNFGSGLQEVSVDVDSPPKVNSDGTIGSTNIKHGDPWPPAGSNYKTLRKGNNDSLETIIPGVFVNKKECTTSGQHTSGGDNCTSLYFTPAVFDKLKTKLTELKNKSGASKIIITGGSEAWWHKTHGPSSAVLDIRSTTADSNDASHLNTYFYGSNTFPGKCTWHPGKNQFKDGLVSVLSEDQKCKSIPHSHVVFK